MALSPHVRRGSPLRIPHTDYNAFLDAANAHARKVRTSAPGELRDVQQPGVILVRSTHNDVLDQFSAVGLESPLILPSQNLAEFKTRVAFDCGLPTADSIGKFGILQEPLLPGAIGRAVVSGVTPALLVTDDATAEFCDISAGLPYLVNSSTGNAQILYSQGVSAAPELAVVRLSMKRSPSESTPPFHFWDPVLIKDSDPLGAGDSISRLSPGANAGVVWRSYVGDAAASYITYLPPDPINDPANQWDDAIVQLDRAGTWSIRTGFNGSKYQPLGGYDPTTNNQQNTGTTSSHTHTYFQYEPLESSVQMQVLLQDADAQPWKTLLGLAAVTFTNGSFANRLSSATYRHMVNVPAGARLRLKLGLTADQTFGDGYNVTEAYLELQWISSGLATNNNQGLTWTESADLSTTAGNNTDP